MTSWNMETETIIVSISLRIPDMERVITEVIEINLNSMSSKQKARTAPVHMIPIDRIAASVVLKNSDWNKFRIPSKTREQMNIVRQTMGEMVFIVFTG